MNFNDNDDDNDNDNDNMADNDNKARPIEIVLGNKNVAEAGSQQINISQNVFNADALKEVLNSLNGLNGSNGFSKEESPQPSTVNPQPSKTSQTSSKSKKTKPKAGRIVEDTFTYKWILAEGGVLRLTKLYQKLTSEKLGWLDASVSIEDWCYLFSGKTKAFVLKWNGTQAHLKYLFKLMIEREYITVPKGAGQWEIVGSHFKNEKSKPFKDWNDQKDPVRGAEVISALVELLNIAADLPAEETDAETIESMMEEYSEHERNNPWKPKFVSIDDMRQSEWNEED